MRKPKDPSIQKNAAELRRNQTDAETILWCELRMHQMDCVHFRRQHAVGPFIADFCAPMVKLIIEVDGGQHLEQDAYDLRRTEFLKSQGYKVLRFWDHEVLQDVETVLQAIFDTIQELNNSLEEPPPTSPI